MQNVQCTYPPLEQALVDAIRAIEQRHDGFSAAEWPETIDHSVGVVPHSAATESPDRTVSAGARFVERLLAGLRTIGQPRLGTWFHDSPRASTSVDMKHVRSAYSPVEHWRWVR